MSTGLAEGTIFAGRYRVVRCIAVGGMGAVYEVVHIETERRRALKVMHPHILQSADMRERFQRESKVAAHVESDFIVDVFDAGYDEATRMPFLVMELLRGEELGQRLKRMRRLPAAEVVTYLHQTAVALDKTHKASIVHRDLKPENLFLTERDDGPPRVKVLDFGVAKVIAEGATSGGPTQSIGTPLYMAPEQFNPRARLTGAADRYALAMMAYTLLVGSAYWAEEARGGNIIALAMVAVHGPREPASARAARHGVTLPPAFDAWFSWGTAADPANRPPTAVDMVAALSSALGIPAPGTSQRMSVSGVTGAPMLAIDSSRVATPSAAAYSAPGALPTTTAEPPAKRSPATAILLVAAGLAVFAVAGVIVLVALGRSSGGGASSASVPTADSATARPTAVPAAPTVTAGPSVIDIDDPAVGTATAQSAAAKPTVAPSSSKPGAPAPRATATPGKPPADPQRKMWGRD